MVRSVFYAVVLAALSTSVMAQFTETEANDTKAASNLLPGLVSGATITGSTTGSSTTVAGAGSADYFRLSTAAAALGIYKHELVITSAVVGHSGTIRGLTSTAGVPNAGTDAALQTSSTLTTPPRQNQWYGFGLSEEVIWRITGIAATVNPYTATLTSTPVVPINCGIFKAGSITIARGAGNTADTDFWVYDATFTPVPNAGNDDPNLLTRVYTPGTYYISYTNFNFANNLGSAGNPGETFLTGTTLDFPNAAVNSSTSVITNLGIAITDSCGTVTTAATKAEGYDIVWATFTVIPLPPSGPDWQVNSANCDLNIDGIQNTPTGPIDVTKCVGTFSRINICSVLAGMPWDLCFSFNLGVIPPNPCGPGTGGIRTANGQVINLDLGSSGCWFDLQFTNAFPVTANCGDFRIPFISATPFANISAQMVILDPSHPDGVCLSALNQLHYVPSGTLPVAGPTGDDSFVAVPLGNSAPGCIPLPGPLPFYCQLKTQLFVSTNGRVTFNAGDASFSASVLGAMTGQPMAGLWADMNQNSGGTIDITNPVGNLISVNYNAVPYFSSLIPSTFSIVFDTSSGVIAFTGLAGVGVDPIELQFVGLSPGAIGLATDPGSQPFTPAGFAAGFLGTDMVYAFGTAGASTAGLNEVVFIPNANCGYDWTSN